MWSETAIFEGAPPASGWAHGVGNFSEQNWGDSPERHQLNDKQKDRLDTLFADDAHVEVEVTWSVYQRMIAAYRHENRRHGRELMARLIDSISTGVPKALVEITKLGRTLKKRAADVLAYFDRPSTSNGPTEAICECLPGWSGTGWSGWFRSR